MREIQGSLIALLFLVLLYSMPSALVLYWTCNMAFALFKEIFKQIKIEIRLWVIIVGDVAGF